MKFGTLQEIKMLSPRSALARFAISFLMILVAAILGLLAKKCLSREIGGYVGFWLITLFMGTNAICGAAAVGEKTEGGVFVLCVSTIALSTTLIGHFILGNAAYSLVPVSFLTAKYMFRWGNDYFEPQRLRQWSCPNGGEFDIAVAVALASFVGVFVGETLESVTIFQNLRLYFLILVAFGFGYQGFKKFAVPRLTTNLA